MHGQASMERSEDNTVEVTEDTENALGARNRLTGRQMPDDQKWWFITQDVKRCPRSQSGAASDQGRSELNKAATRRPGQRSAGGLTVALFASLARLGSVAAPAGSTREP